MSNVIKYTARDNDSIKKELIEYSKRYYNGKNKDFSSASFGSMFFSNVSYVGDVLSMYLDFAVNELDINTARDYESVLKFGYIPNVGSVAYGKADFYITIPANSDGVGYNTDYVPVLMKGSVFAGTNNLSYILSEDVDFSKEGVESRVGEVSEGGNPSNYILKSSGNVYSGELKISVIEVTNYEQFKKVRIYENDPIVEIISVTDSDGKEYYQVENLAQNLIYDQIPNSGSTSPSFILKPRLVARRFIFSRDEESYYIQFGGGTDEALESDVVNRPQDLIMEMTGKNYISDLSFDYSKLIKNDKFGVVPVDTNLTIVYRVSSLENSNLSVGALNVKQEVLYYFKSLSSLDEGLRTGVEDSLSVYNSEPIIGFSEVDTLNELKEKVKLKMKSQERVVNSGDYKFACYSMPPRFGSIARVNSVSGNRNYDSNKNKKVYVCSFDSEGKLTETNNIIKNNLKVWLNQRTILDNDIYIMDLKIVNLGFDFEVVSEKGYDKYSVLNECYENLNDEFQYVLDGGEPFKISKIYSILNNTEGVLDVTKVKIYQKRGVGYSSVKFNLDEVLSADGTILWCPENVVFEIREPNQDIRGSVR